jgi:YgiT-type zinc finger domain-containing protein
MAAIKKHTYDYGECEICDPPMEERYIKQDFGIHGELIVVDHVLAGVCPNCGEKVVNTQVGQQIFKLFENKEQIAAAPHISVPVLTCKEYEDEHVLA